MMPGVPDARSFRTLLEMGYKFIDGTFWWPEPYRATAGRIHYRHRHFMDPERWLEA